MPKSNLAERVEREREHGKNILLADESNWGWQTPAGQLRRLRRVRFLTEPLSDCRGRPRVLELGCGTGTFTREIASRFPELTAVDISDALLETARQRLPGVDFRRADAHRLEFPEQTFELVLGCSVLHHLEWDLALAEIFRVLKPGGVVRFSEPNLLNPQIFLQKNWPWLKRRVGDSPDEYAFTAGHIARCLTRRGFESVQVTPYEFLHPSTPPALMGVVGRIESWLERTPLRHIGGSLQLSARRPGP